MDRSFLSSESLIEASRDFVCIRLATYEDAEEVEFLNSINIGPRGGELENTLYTLMDPDATTLLVRPDRSPQFRFRSPDRMVEAMDTIMMAYPANEEPFNLLPQMKNFRLALNVASCDGLPLVVAVSDDEEQMKNVSRSLTTLAFHEQIAGRAHFVTTTAADVSGVEGFDSAPGIYVIQPGTYGVDGAIAFKQDLGDDVDSLQTKLVEHLNSISKADKDHSRHVANGYRDEILWETETPVTDQGSLRAAERHAAGDHPGGGGGNRGGQGDRQRRGGGGR